MILYYGIYQSKIGPILIVTTKSELVRVSFDINFDSYVRDSKNEVIRKTKAWLDGYFSGKSHDIAIPIKLEGTEFQKKVWKIIKDIPYGATMTYKEIARMISPTMSAQAVGQTVGKNPIAIIIPCHRVIGTNGALTGYRGGLKIKEFLLRHENVLK